MFNLTAAFAFLESIKNWADESVYIREMLTGQNLTAFAAMVLNDRLNELGA